MSHGKRRVLILVGGTFLVVLASVYLSNMITAALPPSAAATALQYFLSFTGGWVGVTLVSDYVTALDEAHCEKELELALIRGGWK